ncbi:MAG TPA: glycine rich domain-containing protein [Bacilli bacterium]|nr:glycine rich domain-containing protein [Bacilli bacterium]
MNNKGLALSSILYTLLVLFLALLFGILGLITSGKLSLDKIKTNVSNKLNKTTEISNIPKIEVSLKRYDLTAMFSDDNLIVAYAITTTNQTPSTWNEINTPSASYALKYKVPGNNTYYIYVKDDANNITTKEIVVNAELCNLEIGRTWTYDYEGIENSFEVPCYGTYKLETWGAQGGQADETHIGGYGAYAKGEIFLEKNDTLFVNVGGTGVTTTTSGEGVGGYNGGGNSLPTGVSGGRGSGGGATSITLSEGLLSKFENDKDSVIIVAAGGGGGGSYSASYYGFGGAGGGITGVDGSAPDASTIGHGATQTTGGLGATMNQVNGSFGQGAKGGNPNGWGGAGGGGGFYGGGSAANNGAGGGGSSYIGNTKLSTKSMYCYNCTESNVESTKTVSTTNVSDTPTSNYAKMGNGYVKITLISLD